MKNIEQLKTFYNNELKAELQKLDSRRKAIVFKIIFFNILLLAAFVIGVVAIRYFELSWGFIVLSTVLYASFTWMIVSFFSSDKQFYIDFKNKIIERLLLFIDNSLHYHAYKHVKYNDFKASNIFSAKVKHFEGDDLVYGTIDGLEIQFSEIMTTRIVKDKKPQPLFNGLFLVADTHCNFENEIIVLPRKMVNASWVNNTGTQVHVNNSQFDNNFQIYCSDKQVVADIFTDSFMNRMVAFSNASKHDLYFSFKGSKAYFGTSLNKKLFEPKIFASLINFGLIQEYFEDLYNAITIIEELKIFNQQNK